MTGWPTTQIRRLFRIVNGGTPEDSPDNWDGDVQWATPTDLACADGTYIHNTQRTLTDIGLRRGSRAIPAGSLVISTRAPIGYVAETVRTIAFNQGCRGLVPITELDIRFYRYQFISLRDHLVAQGLGSTFMELSSDDLASIRVTVPCVDTQRSIADYLDAETTCIDSLITKKRRLIELLDERNISLAHDMISGKAVPGKRTTADYGWLGDMPADWPLAPVGSQFWVKLGRMLNAERATEGDMRPYIRNINVRWDVIDTNDIAEMDFPAPERSRYALRRGDLLINEGGAGMGRSALWNGELSECYFQKSVLRLRPLLDCNPAWMLECMRVTVAKKVFLVDGNLATIPHLPAEVLRARRFPFPPRAVQDELLLRLAKQRNRDRCLREATRHQINLLQERRLALITAAVTGQIGLSSRMAG